MPREGSEGGGEPALASIAAQLNKCGTTGDFNSEMSAMFSRAGDYIRDVWLRVELPEVVSNPGYQARWTRNIGHNMTG